MKRKHLILSLLVLIVILSMGIVATALDPETETEQLKKDVIEMAEKHLPAKRKELKTKTYAGSMDEVIAARVHDVNEVVVYSTDIQVKAKDVCERLGMTTVKKDAIKKLIIEKTKHDKLKKQKQNAEFLKAVTEMLEEATPDVNDPNYVEIVQNNDAFMIAVLEVVTPI